jgi:hypothetical protein
MAVESHKKFSYVNVISKLTKPSLPKNLLSHVSWSEMLNGVQKVGKTSIHPQLISLPAINIYVTLCYEFSVLPSTKIIQHKTDKDK